MIFVTATYILFQAAQVDIIGWFSLIEKFGLPVAFLSIVWVFFSRQNDRRHTEQREFWADNNRYLRELVKESRGQCKFRDIHETGEK